MAYCTQCKVFLAPDARRCPLCKAPAVNSPDSVVAPEAADRVRFAPEIRDADENERLTPGQRRFLVFELLCVTFSILFIVTLFSDLLLNRSITWFRFTALILTILWMVSALPLVLWRHPWILFAIISPASILAVFLWAVFCGNLSWFLPLGLPVSVLVLGVVAGATPLVMLQKKRGLNSIAVILLGASVICTGIDFFVQLYLWKKVAISWSLVVNLSVLPISGLFFYLHYRIMNRASLRKLFRL